MFRLLFFVLLIFSAVSAESCIIKDKKGDPDIQVIELDDSSNDSSEPEIVALQFSDRRRREVIEVNNKERSNFCKNDDDCGSGLICLARLTCVKGTRRTEDPQETVN
ncbi:PREDICTED: uncharacterized protein LOC108778990 [Cyphomyrmex costatus]|uniref:uncharacterized protein LOC108778990 n=1 Tax=Cyphomyrmex costatus TaxID=456900 RepID=UPI00085241FC|nr:PREDICTED: uncharacterized protein LOC108778990 [Cyphomyrmex costatus]